MKQSTRFVIVTYKPNNEVLESLRKNLKDKFVVVIDNAEYNRGFGAGANAGIRKAIAQGAEWVVVVNQDLVVTKAAVRQLVETLKKSPPGIVGPFAGELDSKRWTTIVPSTKMDYISGSCLAIHREAIGTIGYFYEPYFLYYEEVDLCVRAKRAGFPLRHVPVKGISHKESVSLGRGSVLHQYYLARNHLLFVERQAPLNVKIRELVRLPKTLWEHYCRGEKGALAGVRDYLLRRFGPPK